MAFLVRCTSGLTCAPIAPSLASRLALLQMVTKNADPVRTAYTITIDLSADSTTTGISAEDRA
ncbi:3-4-dihydroxy-2-butanone 4-phosphate synthase RibB [Penicillium sp. IBT 35674x]|nr:3-4-dihydroxy-2-butanone 4-phosphate synthase RibB [Penicillium sp. IBT 35674x]